MSGGGDGKTIIVIRKKKGSESERHGGSWKVAYADFVTAMMAFFLVMWIMSMDQGVKDMVQGYFQNPVGFKRSFSGGRNILSQGNSITNLDIRRTVILNREAQEKRFTKVADAITTSIAKEGLVNGVNADVEVVITDEGLRIEMMETGSGATFFDNASAELKPTLRKVLEVVGRELRKLPNDVVVEGHTDARPFGGTTYTNWELSVDRANAARRVLLDAGLPVLRLTGVRGYADRQLKIPDDPRDPRNRRISILLPFFELDEKTAQKVVVVPGFEAVRREGGSAATSLHGGDR